MVVSEFHCAVAECRPTKAVALMKSVARRRIRKIGIGDKGLTDPNVRKVTEMVCTLRLTFEVRAGLITLF